MAFSGNVKIVISGDDNRLTGIKIEEVAARAKYEDLYTLSFNNGKAIRTKILKCEPTRQSQIWVKLFLAFTNEVITCTPDQKFAFSSPLFKEKNFIRADKIEEGVPLQFLAGFTNHTILEVKNVAEQLLSNAYSITLDGDADNFSLFDGPIVRSFPFK